MIFDCQTNLMQRDSLKAPPLEFVQFCVHMGMWSSSSLQFVPVDSLQPVLVICKPKKLLSDYGNEHAGLSLSGLPLIIHFKIP